jgi:hypothetical protein
VTIDCLDRIELDDAGSNPQAIATAIHRQLGTVIGPVPVHEIATALDIVEIRAEPLSSFEGALVTTPERGQGSILVNARAGYPRQRFTVGHELGHFLNPWHRPTSEHGFECSQQDMRIHSAVDRDRHQRQEAEANAFAIELLAPVTIIAPYLAGAPDLQHVLAMSEDLWISKAAAARRYISQHHDCLALVFSHQGRFEYTDRNPDFPWIDLCEGQPLPQLPTAPNNSTASGIEEGESLDWFDRPKTGELLVQTLYQQDDYAITLLQLDNGSDDEDADTQEDTFDRFARY